MIMRLKELYLKSPEFIRKTVRLIPFQYRMGRTFRNTLQFLIESDMWSHDEYHAYQERELARLLNYAIRHIPYYSRYRRLLGGKPFDMLRGIEPITKKDMQRDLDLFVLPEKERGRYHIAYTGGSSGYPLRMYFDNYATGIEWAFMIAQWMRAGYKLGDTRAAFRGIEFKDNCASIIRDNPVYDEVLLSPFHLTDESLEKYVAALKRFKPKFLRGYPSALTVLAKYILQTGVENLPRFEALLCGSESYTDDQRVLLEKAFNTRFFSWYGMTEKVVLAGECEFSIYYHAFPQYGITEIQDKNGNVSSEIGVEGEIVGTGFMNRVMPFIRYRLDDYSQIIADHCEKCGRNHLILGKVTGHRVQDAIIGYSGSRISMTALNMHDETFASVRQFQFHQREPGKVSLNLRVDSHFDDEKRSLIIKSLRQKTGDDIDYDIKLVDRIDSTGIGKGVYLQQEIPIE